MLQFKCDFDAEEHIKKLITTKNVELFKITGQEKDGTILYTWKGEGKAGTEHVTYFGSYNATTKSNKVIFIHDKVINVANCTINQEKTFLGFVTTEQVMTSESFAKRQKQDVFKAYVTEIQPQNIVFYLNLERTHYIRLQFLYGDFKSRYFKRESQLLVFLHKEAVGLYHLPMSRVGDEGMILSSEPKKEQIFHKCLIWSQFDKIHQRLFVMFFRKQGKQASGEIQYQAYLNAYQFDAFATPQLMFDILLDFPIPFTKNSERCQYSDEGPSDIISDVSINMRVFYQANGTYCVCYQHPLSTEELPRTSKHKKDVGSYDSYETAKEVRVEYTVAMVHHGKKLHCVCKSLPICEIKKAKLFFSMIGDYILVQLPGHFTHLLNVGVDYKPCHHILYHDEEKSSIIPTGHYMTGRSTVTMQSNASIFELGFLKGYEMSIDKEALVRLFLCSISPTIRLAIMQYALLHTTDLGMLKSIFESMMNDVCNPEVTELLKEFLIASTYTSYKSRIEKIVLRFIPFTLSEILRSQVHMNAQGDVLATISYSSLHGISLSSRDHVREKSVHRGNEDEFWEHLSVHMLREQAQPSQPFTLKDVDKIQLDEEHQEVWMEQEAISNASLLQKIELTGNPDAKSSLRKLSDTIQGSKPRRPSKAEIHLGSQPQFLQKGKADVELAKDFTKTKVFLHVYTHLKSHLRTANKSKIKTMTEEYIHCQFLQSKLLCHLIWSVAGKEPLCDNNLNEPASEQEYCLFRFFERYLLAAKELSFQIPAGFHQFFAELAFRCLKFRLFIQYVDQHIITITPRFAIKIAKELSDHDDADLAIKHTILQKLPQNEAIKVLLQWNNPKNRKLLAQLYSRECLVDLADEWDYVSRGQPQTR